MLIIIGTIRLPAAALDKARPAMLAMIDASLAEDGCEAYSYAEDVCGPGLICVHEIWRDKAALDAHFETEHLATWRRKWPALGIHDRDLRLYEAGEALQI